MVILKSLESEGIVLLPADDECSVVIENRGSREIIAYSLVWTRLAGETRVLWGRCSRNNFGRLEPGSGLVPGATERTTIRRARATPDQTIEIALDSVLFADGCAVGPDAAGEIERWKAWLDAERDIFTRSASAGLAEMEPLLGAWRDEAPPGVIDRVNGYDNCLVMARGDIARFLLADHDDGRVRTIELVRRIAASKRYPNVRRQ